MGRTGTTGPVAPKPGAQRPWTTKEERYLITHKSDGAAILAAALGRTECAIRRRASRLGVSLRPRPGELCPRCGCYEIRAGTSAAQHGLCPVCWERAKADAMEERDATLREQARYEAAKMRVHSDKRKLARLRALVREIMGEGRA